MKAVAALVVMLTATPTAAAERHTLDLTLDPASGTIAGRDVIVVDDASSLEFSLAPGLDVEEMALDGRAITVEGGGARWSVPLAGRGPHEVVVSWRGTLPPPDPESGPFGQAGLGAEGGFLPAGSGWMPDTGSEAVTFRLSVEVPAGQVAVATGDLVREEREGPYRAVFESRHPQEPPSLFTGPYEIFERMAEGVRLRAYLHPRAAPLADDLLAAAEGHIRRFSVEIGDYPHAGFAIVSAPLPVGLGFPGLTYVGTRVLPLPFFAGRSLAHEILHVWWGNAVRVDRAGGNWAEALTTYMADHALASEEGPERAERMRLDWLRDFAALPPERDTPVAAFTAKEHDAAQVVGYGKGAFVFHMLLGEIGEDAFEEGIRAFWKDNRFGRAGWADLRTAFEAASGRDLGWFFRQWLERPGAPRLFLSAEAEEGVVRVTLRQDGEPWRLAVPVTVETREGREKRHVIRLEGATATARLGVPGTPHAVAADPGHDLFRLLHNEETPPIIRDVTLDPATRTVLLTKEEETARALAAALLEGDSPPLPAGQAALLPGPLLLVGETPEIDEFLHRAGLPPVPKSLAGRGSARAWVARDENGRKLLAVAADNADALDALLRPLPHYRRDSFLVFEGSRLAERGLWPVDASPLRVALEDG